MKSRQIPAAFCWSRMGAEAGEGLAQIIRRKEIERRGCDGVFLWGVGNSLGRSLTLLRDVSAEPVVVFSSMRSKARVADSSPAALRLWLSYINENGEEQGLPPASLVTSRSHTSGGRAKESHYALICTAKNPLDNGPAGNIDASALVNLASGRPVGSSQVTSVVRVGPASSAPVMHYCVNFVAKLQGPGQVRLARSAEIDAAELTDALHAAERCDVAEWKVALAKLKRAATLRSQYPNWFQNKPTQANFFA